ncbi:hypothetical protein ACWEO2_28270 [Nocardia sp. NPDC004278]
MLERRTQDYLRHGITSLFAAFDIADEKGHPGRGGSTERSDRSDHESPDRSSSACPRSILDPKHRTHAR